MSDKPYRPPLRKRLLKSAPVRGALTWLVSLAIRAVFVTSRKRMRYAAASLPYITGGKPVIVCFWHGRMLFMPLFKGRGRRVAALISRHGDGGVIASILGWFGVAAVRGSTSRGGDAALREMTSLANSGAVIAITPDGPRGPHQVAAPGPIWLAARTGLPIIPLSATSSRRRHAKSWDAFTLPLPFGRIICEAGEPMHIPADSNRETIERYRTELERRLSALTHSLDSEVARREVA